MWSILLQLFVSDSNFLSLTPTFLEGSIFSPIFKILVRTLDQTASDLGLHCMLRPVSRKFEPPHDKTNKMTVRPAKTQISLIESLPCAQ